MIEDLAGSAARLPLERAVFLTVLHRLFAGGSDRAADRWREDYAIDGAADIDLHHLYRAMAWLGEELSEDQQDGATLFAPRCLKDVIEEELFARRRNLFSKLDLVFMDTTSLYFEGAGGQTLGQRGFSKDHRPDLNQIFSPCCSMATVDSFAPKCGQGTRPMSAASSRWSIGCASAFPFNASASSPIAA